MRAELTHCITYHYDAPVSLSEHRLCMRPRGHGHQRLLDYQLNISPKPCHSHELVAASGDAIQRVRFQNATNELRFEACSRVETTTAAPLLNCLDGREPLLPYPRGRLNPDLQGALEGWLPNGQHDPSAVALAQDALMGTNQQALSFLNQLIEMIQDRVKYTQRHQGAAWPAARTLRERVGSCRDLAMLMVECCRSIGLPARFVSGYHLANPAPESYDLHAWAEVYLPGAGWRGFDPSAGGETTDRYVVLASSSSPDLTAAITGSFSGLASTQSQLSWTIQATVDDNTNQSAKKKALIQAA